MRSVSPGLVALWIAVASTGCSLGTSSTGGDDDDATEDCSAGLPAPSAPCLPECGNELFVGQPCTEGGGECTDNGFDMAFLCTADFSETDLAFCTMTCVDDQDCGSDALCTGDPDNPAAGRGCFPASCWEGDDDDSAGTDDDDSAVGG